MKKTISIVLVLFLTTFFLTSCGANSKPKGIYRGGIDNDEYIAFDGKGFFAVLDGENLSEANMSGTYVVGDENAIYVTCEEGLDSYSGYFDTCVLTYDVKADAIVVEGLGGLINVSYIHVDDWRGADKVVIRTDDSKLELGTYYKEENGYSYYVQFADSGNAKWASKENGENEYNIYDATYTEEGGNVDLIWGVGNLVVFTYDNKENSLADVDLGRSAAIGMYAYWTKVNDDEFAKGVNDGENDQEGESIGAPASNSLDDIEEWFRQTDIDFYCQSSYVCEGIDKVGDYIFYGLDGDNMNFGYYLYPSIGKIVYVNTENSIEIVEAENFELTSPRNLG